nr:EOG090X0BMA [Cyclestheria hislopi]
MLIKHPLQNQWTLWFFKTDRAKGWEENQREVINFDTIEDFWSLYNHIKSASELSAGCDYSLFKTGIKPMWEDTRNHEGGRWLISLDKKQRSTELDCLWLEVILCLIGEAFEEFSDEICGAVVNIRTKGDKLSIWTSDCKNREGIMKIGMKLKERLGIPPKSTIVYEAHKDTMIKSGSMAKYQFTL